MSPAERVARLAEGQTVVPPQTVLERRLDHYCRMTVSGEYGDAYAGLRKDKALTPEERKRIIAAVNDGLLFGRRLEWGNHGIRRSFRFWSDAQKTAYVERSLEIVDFLRDAITPHVSFGFGSVLGMIRDADMIPHDDDMDLIIALPACRGLTFRKVLEDVRSRLEASGFVVGKSQNLSHLTTARKGFMGTDIFIGFIEPNQSVSWFPSRRGSLSFSDVFPTRLMQFHGHDCPIPSDPMKYLQATYGPDWRTPIANWNHDWDAKQYREFI